MRESHKDSIEADTEMKTYLASEGTGLGKARSSRAKLFGRDARLLSVSRTSGIGSCLLTTWISGEGDNKFPIDLAFFGGLGENPFGLRGETGGLSTGDISGLGGGLTIRPLPEGSVNLIAKRGLGNRIASHQDSADHQRCFPFEMLLRLGVEVLAFNTELRGDGFRYAGTPFEGPRGSSILNEILGAFNRRLLPLSARGAPSWASAWFASGNG